MQQQQYNQQGSSSLNHFFIFQGTKDEKRSSPVEIAKKIPTEPYPVTFSSNSPSPVDHGKHLEKYGKLCKSLYDELHFNLYDYLPKLFSFSNFSIAVASCLFVWLPVALIFHVLVCLYYTACLSEICNRVINMNMLKRLVW